MEVSNLYEVSDYITLQDGVANGVAQGFLGGASWGPSVITPCNSTIGFACMNIFLQTTNIYVCKGYTAL